MEKKSDISNRPRLKALADLDVEEKLTEQAVLAIRKKTLQVDTELGRIRGDVESEVAMLDSQRSYLENVLQQIMEEQSLVLQALTELEDRQNSHKQNIEMIKNEEIEIDKERKDINFALKQLRMKQNMLRETVTKKYFHGSLATSLNASPKTAGFRRESTKIASREYESSVLNWVGSKNPAEPQVKIIRPSEYRASNSIEPEKTFASNSGGQLPQSGLMQEAQKDPMPLKMGVYTDENIPKMQQGPILAKAKKPSVLKRIRLAADKFLPEPLRINKPPIAMLEEQVGMQDSVQILETSLEGSAKSQSISVDSKNKMEHVRPIITEPSKDAKAGSLDEEISRFEEKVSKMPSPENEHPKVRDWRSKLTQLITPHSNPADAPTADSQGPVARLDVEEEEDIPKKAEKNQKADIDINAMQFSKSNQSDSQSAGEMDYPDYSKVNPAAQPSLDSQSYRANQSSIHSKSSAISKLRDTSALSADADLRAADLESKKSLSSEEKLRRLHEKLQEMKSALKNLSANEEKREAKFAHLKESASNLAAMTKITPKINSHAGKSNPYLKRQIPISNKKSLALKKSHTNSKSRKK